jgi:hypothetical protein
VVSILVIFISKNKKLCWWKGVTVMSLDYHRGLRGRDPMVVGLRIYMQSVPMHLAGKIWFTVAPNEQRLDRHFILFLLWKYRLRVMVFNTTFNNISVVSPQSPLTLWVRTHSFEVFSMQHYAIKFASHLRQVGGFLRGLHQQNWLWRYNWNIVEGLFN